MPQIQNDFIGDFRQAYRERISDILAENAHALYAARKMEAADLAAIRSGMVTRSEQLAPISEKT